MHNPDFISQLQSFVTSLKGLFEKVMGQFEEYLKNQEALELT